MNTNTFEDSFQQKTWLLGAFELLSFKNCINKEKCETFTNSKSKIVYEQINFVKNVQEVEPVFLTWHFGLCEPSLDF